LDVQHRTEQQNHRRLRAHSALFGDSLLSKDPESATHHMRIWLDISKSSLSQERHMRNLLHLSRILSILHDVNDMSENGDWRDASFAHDMSTLLKTSLGSLRDLHIDVIKEYLSYNPCDEAQSRKLGRLFALRRQLGEAKDAFAESNWLDVQSKNIDATETQFSKKLTMS